jgi:hypothetical protein
VPALAREGRLFVHPGRTAVVRLRRHVLNLADEMKRLIVAAGILTDDDEEFENE